MITKDISSQPIGTEFVLVSYKRRVTSEQKTAESMPQDFAEFGKLVSQERFMRSELHGWTRDRSYFAEFDKTKTNVYGFLFECQTLVEDMGKTSYVTEYRVVAPSDIVCLYSDVQEKWDAERRSQERTADWEKRKAVIEARFVAEEKANSTNAVAIMKRNIEALIGRPINASRFSASSLRVESEWKNLTPLGKFEEAVFMPRTVGNVYLDYDLFIELFNKMFDHQSVR